MKLLLVEDNPADVRLMHELLRESARGSFQCQQVGRLDSALERLRQENFDVVLLDLGLPDSQGMKTLTLAQKATSSVPFVVLTGLDDERVALEAARAGAQDYLVKGRFDGELLLRTIRYAVERKRAEVEVHRLNVELEQRVAERTAQLQRANDELLKEILERKRAEELLRESEERFRLAVKATKDAVWDIDLASGMVHWNETYGALYGRPPETANSWQWWIDHIHPEDRERTASRLRSAISGRESTWSCEYRFQRVDGAWADIHDRAYIARDGSGKAWRVIGAMQDLTERKRAEQALQEAQAKLKIHAAELEKTVASRTAKLQETVAELEHFSYAIVHDMRAPLRAMRSFAALIEEDCGGCQHTVSKDYFRRIKIASNRMDQLITDSLSYSQTARQELTLEPVDLSELIDGLVQTYPNLQPELADIQIEPNLPLVLGNQAALTQCFSNLLDNAVKFAKAGSRPQVSIRAETRPRSEASARPSKHELVRIWVEDDGIGIPRAFLPRAFEIFQRGTNRHEGTGIGLAIVRKVARAMGGEVGVESKEGKGSRFWVDLVKAG